MPAGNRQGPQGEGPRTGRALGYCSGYDRPGCETSNGGGRGFGRGAGRGCARGAGRRFRHGQGFLPEEPVVEQRDSRESLLAGMERLSAELSALRRQVEGLSADHSSNGKEGGDSGK